MEPCNQNVFKNGFGICFLDAGSVNAEAWVQKVAAFSGQQVDWHYSGGIANVLYIGDYEKVIQAVNILESELVGQVLRKFGPNEHGGYRAGDPLDPSVRSIKNI